MEGSQDEAQPVFACTECDHREKSQIRDAETINALCTDCGAVKEFERVK